jgi:hypothetical protein
MTPMEFSKFKEEKNVIKNVNYYLIGNRLVIK